MRCWLLLPLLALTACAPSRDAYDVGPEASAPAEMPAAEMAADARASGGAEGEAVDVAKSNATSLAAIPSATARRKTIYTADVNVQVEDVQRSLERVYQEVKRRGGFVAGLEQSAGDGTPGALLTIRVPAGQFDATMDVLAALGKLQRRDIKAEDVTAEFVDVEARLRNKQREEARLLDLLAQAKQMSDLLRVEERLSAVRGEIEQMQGRLRYLSDQVDLCTIRLRLDTPASQTTTTWSLAGAADGAWQLFLRTGRATIGFVLGLLAILPFVALYLLLAAAGLWLLRRLFGRRRPAVEDSHDGA